MRSSRSSASCCGSIRAKFPLRESDCRHQARHQIWNDFVYIRKVFAESRGHVGLSVYCNADYSASSLSRVHNFSGDLEGTSAKLDHGRGGTGKFCRAICSLFLSNRCPF